MRIAFILTALLASAMGSNLSAEPMAGSGRGGAFAEFHTTGLSNLDSTVSGNPIVVGGEGYTYLARNFRLGGAGGAAFLMNATQATRFGMGYGGIVGQYLLTSWLSLGLLVGAGAYSVSEITVTSNTTTITNMVAADGFLLIKPELTLQIPVGSWFWLGGSVSYFLPNLTKLQGVNLGLHLIVGRD